MQGWLTFAGFACLAIASCIDVRGKGYAVVLIFVAPIVAAVALFAMAAGIFGP